MPAVMMTDGHDPDLFEHFSITAQKLGVYTAVDYANILDHLVEIWDIEHIGGLSGEGARYQEKLCKLGPRYLKLAEMSLDRVKKMPKTPYSWIHGRMA
jgi:acyl-[acyl-carrier-protein] desaturase